MLLTIIKTIIFFTPFIKELFLGKSGQARPQPPDRFSTLLKKTLIIIGCFSIGANIFFLNRLFILGGSYLAAQRELAQLKGLGEKQAANPPTAEKDRAQSVQRLPSPIASVSPPPGIPSRRVPPPRAAPSPPDDDDVSRLRNIDAIE